MIKLILKAALYRIGALLLTFFLFFLVFGELKEATFWTIGFELAHTLWYIVYENIWKKYKKLIFK